MSVPSPSLAVVVLALAGASAGCAPLDAPWDGDQRTGALTAGILDAGDAAVVAIMFADHAACTGVLVATRVVLTAAHCLVVHSAMPRVLFGSDAANPQAVIDVDADGIFVHADFSPLSRAHDIAALVLQQDAPVGISPLAMAPRLRAGAGASVVGEGVGVRLVGFGHDSDPVAAGAPHVKREGTATITSLAADMITLSPAPSQACLGDSGGPVLATAPGGAEVLAGLVLGGITSCVDAATALRVDAYADSFITPVIAGAGMMGTGQPATDAGGCAVTGASPAARSLWPVVVMVAASLLSSSRRTANRKRHVQSAARRRSYLRSELCS
ncbi:MAG: S1 family peptidase [Myxococcales bacterium]